MVGGSGGERAGEIASRKARSTRHQRRDACREVVSPLRERRAQFIGVPFRSNVVLTPSSSSPRAAWLTTSAPPSAPRRFRIARLAAWGLCTA
jgi:hypothetical protein